ncbi:HTH-type transcriptional regulator XynR [Baekduia alba]|nr:HTH-type transcriptional regulator XynR [Baekduia alba]
MLRVLEAATESARPLSVRELAERADVPRSTAHRLANELVAWGGLERGPTGLRPALKLFELGQRVPRQRRLRDVALPVMHDLHAATGRLVQLAILDGADTVCLEQLAPRGGRPIPSRPGGRMPAHATAMGKVLLAHAPAAAREGVVRAPLSAVTPQTITTPPRLRAELARIRRRGYATNHEESQRGLHGVAVPVRAGEDVVAALAVSVRTAAELPRVTVALQATGPAITRALGA